MPLLNFLVYITILFEARTTAAKILCLTVKISNYNLFRGGSRAAATSKMECFVITVSVFQSLTIITKPSILDVAAALDTSPILAIYKIKNSDFFCRIPEVPFLRKRVYYCTG